MLLRGSVDAGEELERGDGVDEPMELRAAQNLTFTCLLEEHWANDDAEVSGQAQADQATGDAGGADRSGYDDVGVDDDPEHLRRRPAGSISADSTKLGYRERHRFVVIEEDP